MPEKRGQMYLLAAILIAFAIFIILSPANIIYPTTTSTNFDDIARNFDQESARFLNHLFESNPPNIADAFLNFTVLFTSYAKTKNSEFGVIYAFAHKDIIYIGNYDVATLDIDVAGSSVTQLPGCAEKITAQATVLGLNVPITNIERSAYTSCMSEITIPPAIQPPYTLHLTIHDAQETPLTLSLEPSHPDIIILAREAAGNVRKVYIKGDVQEISA